MITPPLQGEGDRGARSRGGGALPQTAPPVIETARKLRRTMSSPEVLLWQRLRGSPDGIRFRRQHPVGPYVVDFYCSAARLVIEVDGAIHDDRARAAADVMREAFLVAQGLQVIRLSAADVLRDVDGIASEVLALAGAPLHHQPPAMPEPGGPPPRSGEEL